MRLVLVVFILLMIVGFAGCGKPPETIVDGDVPVVRIDDCQYLKNQVSHYYYVHTHKGNCDNPIHIYNKVKTDGS
jgi:hypothetical protein